MKLDVKELQNTFKTDLNKISNERFNSEEQKSTLQNIKLLYESRQAVTKLFNEYSLIASEAKWRRWRSKHGEGLKILTPIQLLITLPITLAHVKAGNTSKNLLNEIRQIIYSLYQAK